MHAIRDLVLNKIRVLSYLINILMVGEHHYEEANIITKMLAELLVYGDCVSDGTTKQWLEENEGEHQEFMMAVSNEFATKAMGEASPDIMARCAYHAHLPESECDTGPHGRAWEGKSIRR